MRFVALLSLPVLMLACDAVSTMNDNSLEAHELSGLDFEEAPAGTLEVIAGDQEGDWVLTLGETSFDYHSPSHADLSILAGRTLTASISDEWGGAPPFQLREGEQVVFSMDPFDDGTQLFGETRWEFGETLGKGDIINEYAEPTAVIFRAVTVHADDGDVSVSPGEPISVKLDGATWQLTVLAAYQIDDQGGLFGADAKCGPSDLLSVELMLTEEAPGELLSRPDGAISAMTSCG